MYGAVYYGGFTLAGFPSFVAYPDNPSGGNLNPPAEWPDVTDTRPEQWTTSVKAKDSWANNNVKQATHYTPTPIAKALWGVQAIAQRTLYVQATHQGTMWGTIVAKLPTRFQSAEATTVTDASWARSGISQPAQFTETTRSHSDWGVHYQPVQDYFYDSSFTYDDYDLYYDYIINFNQINQRLQTAWSNV